MKHKFLLDVTILYHAIKEVDEAGNPDSTAADLVELIGSNCHTVLADRLMVDRYRRHIRKLFRIPSLLTPTALFITRVLENSAKFVREDITPPMLPEGVKIPKGDDYVVRAALISHPIIVTSDNRLRKAINNQRTLGLKALTPNEALELAKES